MKEIITVKKSRSHVYGVRAFTVFYFIVAVAIAVCVGVSAPIAALLLIFWCIFPLPMLLYFETWQITFSADKICKRLFFCKAGVFSYQQLKDAIKAWSYTEQGYVRLIFDNGKSIKFRLTDENADKAIKRICSHHSIRVL